MAEKMDQPSKDPEEQRSQAQILIQLAADARLFHTPEGQAFAQVPSHSHQEILTIRGKNFRSWLIRKFYAEYAKPPGSQALQDAIGVLEAQAQFDYPEAALFVRIADSDGRIYIDLCNAEREVIEIDGEGWRLVAEPPVHFRRPRGMRPLPRPVIGGSIAMLRRFINVGDDNNWILCAAWLVFVCNPKGPYPILIIQGEQGAAKSTMAKILRRIIDSSVALVRTPPKDDRDLLIAANNSWLVTYDNLSGIQPWLSDALCRLATGSGFSTRELYSDADEVFFDAARPVMLNGIDHLAERADLADRALILNLPSIEEENRKDEQQLYAEFERDLPQILSALFTAVSCALRRLPQITLKRLPRMADFARFATAAEPGLGFEPEAFMRAYLGNRTETIQETLEADPVGAAVLAMMEKLREQGEKEQWDGSCKDLLQYLEQFVDDSTKKSRGWPSNPRSLSSRLRRLATFLRASGIHITFCGKGGKGRRSLTIARTPGVSTAATATTATPDSDGIPDQSDSSEDEGGFRTSRVAVQSPSGAEPPPQPQAANALEEKTNRAEVAKVAEVAVETPANLTDHHELVGPVEPTDICERCGAVDWRWLGAVRVCRACGQEAGHGRDGQCQRVERFEV